MPGITVEVVRVHLADVAALVRSQGDLDHWAAKKACSIYFRDYNGELKCLSSKTCWIIMVVHGCCVVMSMSKAGSHQFFPSFIDPNEFFRK